MSAEADNFALYSGIKSRRHIQDFLPRKARERFVVAVLDLSPAMCHRHPSCSW